MDEEKLGYLAEFIRIRNVADQSVARLIGRPAHAGHIAEFVASKIFDIELHFAATVKASDGFFRSGPFRGKSVNVKYGSRNSGILDVVHSLDAGDHPDVYLVFTGPRSGAVTSRNTFAPWVITDVYVFESMQLLKDLRGLKLGVATSIRRQLWQTASIYPEANDVLYPLSPEQRALLKLFAPMPILPE